MQHKSTDKQFGHKDVRILRKEVVYQGYFQMLKYQLQHRLFSGGWSEIITREMFVRGQVAGILLYDPLLNKVVLIEQFRVGALDSEHSPWLLEIVAGVLDNEDRDAEVSARREIQEETGLEPQAIIPICHYWVSPGGCNEQVQLFCAKVDASKAGGTFGLATENEDIRVVILDTAKAFEAVAVGRICNALSIIALQWLQLNQTRVNDLWVNR